MKTFTKTFILVCFMMQVAYAQADFGLATIYSDSYHGNMTESGDVYDKNKLTAAHKSLPFNTLVRLTNPDNKRTITVRINDRGAFYKGDKITISSRAAKELMMDKEGKLKIEIVKRGSPDAKTAAKTEIEAEVAKAEEERPDEYENKAAQPEKAEASTAAKAAVKKESTAKKTATPKAKKTAAKETTKQAPAKDNPYDLYKVQAMMMDKEGFGVQIGSYSSYESVLGELVKLNKNYFKNILISRHEMEDGKRLFKLILGPFPDEPTAKSYQKALLKKKIKGFVVNLGGL